MTPLPGLVLYSLCSCVAFAAFFTPPLLAPLCSICLLALSAFAGAFFGLAQQARDICLLLACGGGLAGLIWLALERDRERMLTALAVAGIHAGLQLLILWHYQATELRYWDEFFLGGFVKHLLHVNAWWTWDAVLPRHDASMGYPPGIALIQYMFQPRDSFAAPLVAVGEYSVIFASLGVLAHCLPGQLNSATRALALVCAFLLFRAMGAHFENGSYVYGYGEAIQLSLFTALFFLIKSHGQRHRSLLLAGLGLLGVCKPTGAILACFLACYATATTGALHKRAWGKALREVALLLTPVALGNIVWKVHVALHIPQIADTGGLTAAGDLLRALATSLPPYVHAFFARSLVAFYGLGNIPIVTTFALLCLLGWAIRKRDALITPTDTTFLLGSFLVWLGVHFVTTVLFMSPQEQAHAASYERYIAVVLCPVAVLLTLFALTLAQRAPWGRRAILLLLAALVAALGLLALDRPGMDATALAPARQAAAFLETHTPPHARYVLVSDTHEYNLNNACQFLLMPGRREVDLATAPYFNPHTRPSALYGGEGLGELCREFGVEFVLVLPGSRKFLEHYGAELGMRNTEARNQPPLLWDMRGGTPRRIPLDTP